MNSRTYFIMSGLVFGAVAVIHLLRALNGWAFVIGPWTVPVWASWLGVVVTGVLCVSATRLAMRDPSV